MPKEKPTFIETLLKQSGTMKDYDKVITLYEKYQKETNPNRLLKAKEELVSHLTSALESLSRLSRVYTEQSKEVTKEANELGYDQETHKPYLDVINKRLEVIEQIKENLDKYG